MDRRFTPEIEIAVFRVIQEALTNVARYAAVDLVQVRLWLERDHLQLRIEDQGLGFDPQVALSAGRSSGLSGMQERFAFLDGQLEIESARGRGTQIMGELPLTSESERA